MELVLVIQAKYLPKILVNFEKAWILIDTLFAKITSNMNHLLHQLLPPRRETYYSLRPRAHDFMLSGSTALLNDNNYTTRMLYKNIGCL